MNFRSISLNIGNMKISKIIIGTINPKITKSICSLINKRRIMNIKEEMLMQIRNKTKDLNIMSHLIVALKTRFFLNI